MPEVPERKCTTRTRSPTLTVPQRVVLASHRRDAVMQNIDVCSGIEPSATLRTGRSVGAI